MDRSLVPKGRLRSDLRRNRLEAGCGEVEVVPAGLGDRPQLRIDPAAVEAALPKIRIPPRCRGVGLDQLLAEGGHGRRVLAHRVERRNEDRRVPAHRVGRRRRRVLAHRVAAARNTTDHRTTG